MRLEIRWDFWLVGFFSKAHRIDHYFQEFWHSFIHSFCKYFMSISCMPHTVLGARDKAVNKTYSQKPPNPALVTERQMVRKIYSILGGDRYDGEN